MPTPDESKRAGNVDVAEFGDKDISGAYPPGTRFELDDGTSIEPEKVPDIIGKGRPKQRPPKPPAQ